VKVIARRKGNPEAKLQAANERMSRKLTRGLAAAGRVLLKEARALTPVDTSALVKSSRTYTLTTGGAFDVTVVVGYAPPDAPAVMAERKAPYEYAVYVHEVNAHHEPPTQWKFLEVAAAVNRDAMRSALRSAVQEK
jgi:hypothetical protein